MPEQTIDAVSLAGFAEPLASWLHLGGAFLALLATDLLAGRGSTRGARAALRVFGLSAAFALFVSGIYHATEPGTEARAVLRRLDHAGIWLLIAGTCTPVHVILFRGAYRWGMLGFIWAAAVAGIVLKTIFFARFPEALGLGLYLGLGWLGAVSGTLVWRRHGWRAIRPMLTGGMLYSVGGAVSVIGHPVLVRGFVGHHELFHIAVLAAVLAHWRFMESLEALGPVSVAVPAALRPAVALARS